MITLLVDRDKHLLDLRLRVRGCQMYHIVITALVKRVVISLFIKVDEVVGIDGLQLRLRGIGHVHLVVVLHVGPLRLAVKPNGSLWRCGIELPALYRNTTLRVAVCTRHSEIGLDTFFGRNCSSSLIEYALSRLPVSGDAHQHRRYQKTNLFHYPLILLILNSKFSITSGY